MVDSLSLPFFMNIRPHQPCMLRGCASPHSVEQETTYQSRYISSSIQDRVATIIHTFRIQKQSRSLSHILSIFFLSNQQILWERLILQVEDARYSSDSTSSAHSLRRLPRKRCPPGVPHFRATTFGVQPTLEACYGETQRPSLPALVIFRS